MRLDQFYNFCLKAFLPFQLKTALFDFLTSMEYPVSFIKFLQKVISVIDIIDLCKLFNWQYRYSIYLSNDQSNRILS